MAKKLVPIAEDVIEAAEPESDPNDEVVVSLIELRRKFYDTSQQYDNGVQVLIEALGDIDLDNDFAIESVLDVHLPSLHALFAQKEAAQTEVLDEVDNLVEQDSDDS